MSNWTLFSNHGHVLVCLARDSESRLRDVAADVGITERAVQKIVRDLQDGGMVSVTKHGRRNRYQIHNRQPLRHDLETHCTLGELIGFVNGSKPEHTAVESTDPVEPEPVPIEPKPVAIEPEPVVSEPEPAAIEQVETPPAKPEPTTHTLASPVTEESSFGKEKPEKPEAEDSTEKQQGSLF
jgi:hypothetical protein